MMFASLPVSVAAAQSVGADDRATALARLLSAPDTYVAARHARIALSIAEDRVLAKDHVAAQRLLEEAVRELGKRAPQAHLARAALLDGLAAVLDAQGRLEERVRMLTRARDALVEALGPRHTDSVRARHMAAAAMIEAAEYGGDTAGLMTIARQELESLEADAMETFGRGHPVRQEVTVSLASLDLAAGDERGAGYRLDEYFGTVERLSQPSDAEISSEIDALALDLHDDLDLTTHACRAVTGVAHAHERVEKARWQEAASRPAAAPPSPPRSLKHGASHDSLKGAPVVRPDPPAGRAPDAAEGKNGDSSGWIEVSFCVTAQGRVDDPVVLRFTAEPAGQEALLRMLTVRTYEPAPDSSRSCRPRHERLSVAMGDAGGLPRRSILEHMVDGALLDGDRVDGGAPVLASAADR